MKAESFDKAMSVMEAEGCRVLQPREKGISDTYRVNTIILAVPAILNGVRGYVAVVVKGSGKTHYKTHRVVLVDKTDMFHDVCAIIIFTLRTSK